MRILSSTTVTVACVWQYGVGRTTVYKICSGKRWVEHPSPEDLTL